MRYHIKHLGPIKEATIDVKPLTIFVGPNNAGKTWAMHLWASIAGAYNHHAVVDAVVEEGADRAGYEEVFAFAGDLASRGTARVDLGEAGPHLVRAFIGDLCRMAARRFAAYVGTTREEFPGLAVSLDVADDLDAIIMRLAKMEIRIRVGGRDGSEALLLRKARGGTVCEGLVVDGAADSPSAELLAQLAASTLLQAVHQAVVRDVVCFPTERPLPFCGLMPPLKVLESTIRLGSGDPSPDRADWAMSQPLANALWVAGDGAKASRRPSGHAGLADILEARVLGGSVAADDGEGGTEYVFELPETGVRLECAMCSSMVKELALLAIYLRYQAESGETLCIDEPEMNLHPEAQAKLTEFLGILVNSGLNVMATTHSPYLVDHLANLLKAGAHEDRDETAAMFYLQDPRAFLTPDQVGVYLFEGGEVRSIMDDDGYIDWGTFGDVSDRISTIYYNL